MVGAVPATADIEVSAYSPAACGSMRDQWQLSRARRSRPKGALEFPGWLKTQPPGQSRRGFPVRPDSFRLARYLFQRRSNRYRLEARNAAALVRGMVPGSMKPESEIPRATYRLQLNRDFTFAQAQAIVPYLSALGISHYYISPCLKARPGSMHGYDIVDHNSLNPEIGTPEEFDYFVSPLHQHGMGLFLNIFPNNMAGRGSKNAWWLDVLENGEASIYSCFFDIDWRPLKEELHGKVLVPVLHDHYGAVLESGELKLGFREESGEFDVSYRGHRFPVGPREYPRVLKL